MQLAASASVPGEVALPAFVDGVRAAFELPELRELTPVSRGAMGWAWRAQAGHRRLCVKHFFVPPDLAALPHEIAFTELAVASGIDAPVGLPSRDGDFAVGVEYRQTTHWVRAYTWCEGEPLAAPRQRLGEVAELLALLHRIDYQGGRAHPWYDTIPGHESWQRLGESALARDRPWATALAARQPAIAALSALVEPAPDAPRQTCHLDLSPANVLADPSGRLALLDWGDAGPGNPDRELASVLLSWAGADSAGLALARRCYDRYLDAGGPGRLAVDGTISMYAATRLNYLYSQSELSLAAGGDAYAAGQVAATLRALPSAAELMARQQDWRTW